MRAGTRAAVLRRIKKVVATMLACKSGLLMAPLAAAKWLLESVGTSDVPRKFDVLQAAHQSAGSAAFLRNQQMTRMRDLALSA
jgi:hypothetical protein